VNLRRIFHLRLIIAIQAFTTLIILGFGYFVVEVSRQELLSVKQPTPAYINNVIQQLRLEVLIAAVVASLCGIALAIAISRPLQTIVSSAQKIARGDLTSTVELRAESEVEQLGDAFNRMITSLNNHVMEIMSGGSLVLDMDGRIVSANSGMAAILGCQAEELTGKYLKDLFPEVESNRKVHEIFQKAVVKLLPSQTSLMDVMTFKGDRLKVRVSTILLKRDGNPLVGLSMVPEDLNQIGHLREEISRADRLAAMGAMAASMAHEIRNPLGSIKGMAQLISEDLPADHPNHRYLKVIIREIDRVNKVIRDLLDFARPVRRDSHERRPEDINLLVEEAIDKSSSASRSLQIKKELAEDLPLVKVDRDQIIGVFSNLITNALEAMDADDGRIKVSTKFVPDPGDRGQEFVEARFFNTGSYIEPENKEKIFNPFYTTKNKGSGLGLTIALEIIKSYGGDIQVESHPDRGTEFIVRLPTVEK